MTYKLEPWIEKIVSPVVLKFADGEKKEYATGKDAVSVAYDHRFISSTLRAVGDLIEIEMVEKREPVGSEEESFF